MTWWMWLALAAWIACGIVQHGLMYAFFQRRFPLLAERHRWRDFRYTAPKAILGPMALIPAVIFLATERAWFKYGFMLYRRAGDEL